jgi:protein-S-isoprenylcysteine O-methyltransferase Ste14
MKNSREVWQLETQPVYQKLQKVLARNRIRLSLLVFAIFIAGDIMNKVRPRDIFSLQDIWGPVGLFIVLAGAGLRSWAAGIIHKSKSLAATGPYSLTRHPLYIGSLLMAVGFCTIIGDNKNFLVVLAIALIFYVPKIYREETRLADNFREEWNTYVRRTSIFFPKAIPDLHSDWSLSQWLGNREYFAFCTCLIVLALLKLLHEFPLSEIMPAFR